MLKPKVGEIVSTSWPISFFKNVVFPALSSPLKNIKKGFNKFLVKIKSLETFARNSPFARGIPPNRKKTKNGNEISKTMAKSWIKSPNGC